MLANSTMLTKVLQAIPFICQAAQCPKHQDKYNVGFLNKQLPSVKLSSSFSSTGCSQFKTFLYGISKEACSQDDWQQAPLVSVILPSPDPTGAQGAAGGFGFTRDLILETLHHAHPEPLRVAIHYLTRGYSFEKVARGELVQRGLLSSAISQCRPYLEQEIQQLQPNHLLLCGPEVVASFFNYGDIASFRRKTGLSVEIGGKRYPVQATYAPHIAAFAPVYIKSLREDAVKIFKPTPRIQEGKAVLLMRFEDVMDLFDRIEQHDGFIALDYETQNLYRKAPNRLGTIQIAFDASTGYVIPYQHRECPFDPSELALIKKRWTRLMRDPLPKLQGWIAHGLKFEQTQTKRHFGTHIRSAPAYDTQAAAFLLDETRSERKMDTFGKLGFYGLKILAYDLLGWDGYDQGILKDRSEGNLLELPLKDLSVYGAMDAWITHALFFAIRAKAAKENYEETLLVFLRLFYDRSTRLISHIEMNGFKVNLRRLRELSGKNGVFEIRIGELEEQLKALPILQQANQIHSARINAGTPRGVLGTVPWTLDLSKPDSKKLIFFQVMDLAPVSWSEKTGMPSIDDEFFEAYREEHAEVALFEKYEEAKKMRDAFVNKILLRVDPETGDPDCRMDQCIRPDIHYSRIVTGRWAMTNPNLQQIPKAEENSQEGVLAVRKAVKDLFTVESGCALIAIDYKVNEVRWAGILARDPELARMFNEAAQLLMEARRTGNLDQIKAAELMEDVHRAVAASMFGTPLDQVTKKQRQVSKAITFGILFQQTASALAEAQGITKEQAEAYMAQYFAKMQAVERLIRELKQFAETYGYVEAPHGRRRRFWSFALPQSDPYRRGRVARSLRQCVNSPVQGIASDSAMGGGAAILLDYIEAHQLPWVIRCVVHDSCLVQVPVQDVAKAIQLAESIFVHDAMRFMEQMGVQFNFPLGIDVEVGIEWGSTEKWNGTEQHAIELQKTVTDYWNT